MGVLSGIGFLEAGSRGKAPGGVSGERCLGDSVKGPPESLSPFAPEGGALKNLHLRGMGVSPESFSLLYSPPKEASYEWTPETMRITIITIGSYGDVQPYIA